MTTITNTPPTGEQQTGAELMQAVRYYAPGDIRVEQIARPQCGRDELLVKVDACAVCGTDLKSMNHGNPRIKAPLTMGHEFTGCVVEVGANAEGFSLGDRVVMATSVSCGQCYYCQQGWRNLCVDLAPMGFSYAGGMAEYITIPARAIQNGHVIVTPADLPAEHAALAEPVSCAVNSLSHCNVTEGCTVLIIGGGPMGLLNACVAQALGAGTILLADVSDARLEQAKPFGFDRLIHSGREDLAQIVKDITGGLGVDIAIVAAPAAQPQEQAVHLVRKRGTVCLFASLPAGQSEITLDSRAVHYGELRVVGTSDSTPEHVKTAVELLASGKIPAARIASHLLPLAEIHKSFELMKSGEALRVVLQP